MPSSDGPRYAPEDPTLPEPWKGLVDGSTGYLYYWNPVTNVTQYEKPAREKKKLPGPPPLPPPPPANKKPVSSSVHVSSHRNRGRDDEYSSDEDGSRSRNHHLQGSRLSSSHSLHSSGDIGHGHGSRASARGHGSSDAGGGLPTEAYRRQHEITITGDDVPPPFTTFESTGFPSEILKEVHRAGFSVPTPIQAQSWPIALKGRDVVAIAKTGSGKTLGYLIPGFIHLKRLRNSPRAGPTVLVLAPTRELATQILDEAEKFGRSSEISCTCVYGGAPKPPQLRALDRGVDVVVATPGRLNDILEMRRISLRQVSYLVLDEADRMLDMGFEPQIRKIVKEIPHRRQTLMYTATWPKEVRKIAADLLARPLQVNIGSIDELVANKAITQYVEVIKPIEKQRRLEQILRSQEPGSKVIVFCSTKRMCDQLAKSLTRQFGAAAIHGDKNQTERDRVLNHFRTGRSPILVATDVAARGLDIKDIRVVINYDFPTGVEDYVHRIGRTGRAGATGVSYTFFSDQDSKYARDLVKVLEGAGQRVPPELGDMVSHRGYGGRSRRWGSGARDHGRSSGGGRSDSGYGGRDGRVLSPSLRPVSDRVGYGRGDQDSRDSRYDQDRSYHDGHKAEVRGRQDPKVVPRGKVRSRSISRSLSPRLSPSRKRGRIDPVRTQSKSRSRSPSQSLGRRQSRSRSRSRNRSRDFDRYGGSRVAQKQSPSPPRREKLSLSPPRREKLSLPPPRRDQPSDHLSGDQRIHSPPPCSPQQRRSPQTSYDDGEIRDDDGEIRDDRVHQLPSPPKERSRSPYQNNGRVRESASPGQYPRSPNYTDGAQRRTPERPVQAQPLPYDGEEEEEGMIHPDEEEGMIA
ncbi:DEAD-box ATP-dependent RNA helicase 14-like [Iris pallida]|uniref:RNA helicase n=1 Tax=Iris pallida TaxID=29817 RepID=A0AAX6GD47_IRIPA|nr:DEAD-box ATP-dependent RNA helicase 14-like [Iris pallida]